MLWAYLEPRPRWSWALGLLLTDNLESLVLRFLKLKVGNLCDNLAVFVTYC